MPSKVPALADLLGESPAITSLREKIERLLQRQPDVRRPPPILIQGETGTGKGLLARAIHRVGPRRDGPLVDVNCAAIPETLLEAEMFGFERGAFTDARQAKVGLFQAAHRGTIFLDEVGLLPEPLQAKLLKVIEEQLVRRLGSTRSEPVDVWIVAATSEDLATAIRDRRFREDLYHRLAVLTVALPPLRERGQDILLLAEHFLARACADYQLPPKQLESGARAALLAYRWPGNVRELANVMERVALLSEDPLVSAPMLGLPESASTEPGPAARRREEAVSLDDAMRDHLLEVLGQTNWNISRGAALLGISRNTLRSRIEKYGLRPGVSPPLPHRRAARPLGTAAGPRAPAPGATRAPPGVRWEPRRLTLLRAALVTPEAAGSPLSLSRALEVLVEKVQSFGGRVEELGPTSVVGAFGLEPVEDAPRRAAHAAMAIHKAVERGRQGQAEPLRVKIGIHVGQFLVGQGGSGLEIDMDAKRQAWTVLEALAAGGELDTTVVSDATTPFLDRRFDLVPVGALERAPGQAYRLGRRERVGLGIARRMVRFVGRRDDLEFLESRWASAVAGHGQVVGIAGEAGIGKSRLLFEFRQTLRGKEGIYLEGRCLSYGIAIPYLPILEILRRNFGITETDHTDALIEKVQAGFRQVEMDPEEGVPYILQLLGVKEGTDRLAALPPEVIKGRTFEILRQVCLHGSRLAPMILALEDLHWIDKTSEECVAFLVESLAGTPILFLCTYRPGYRPPWMEKSYAAQVALQPLSPGESLSVVQSVLQTEQVPEPLARLILAKAEGNPFFLEELTRVMREQGDLRQTEAVPGTIQEVLLARLHRLADEPKRLLQTASILGREVSLRLLGAIWEGPGSAEPHLRELMRLEFLYEKTRAAEPVYVFKHALTQEVAYESLLPARRQALHAAAGRALEQLYAVRLEEVYDHLAHHYSKTDDAAKAVEYLTHVAAKAARAHAHTEVVQAVQEALAHVERLPAEQRESQLLNLILRQGPSLIPLGRIQEILAVLLSKREGLERLEDPSRISRYYFLLGRTYSFLGDHERAAQCARQAMEEATRCGDEATMGKAYFLLAVDEPLSGRARQGVEHGQRAVALLERTMERWWLGPAHWVVGINHAQLGEFEPALEAEARALAIGEEIGDPRLQTLAGWATGAIHTAMGECEAGIEACRRSLECSPDPLNTATASGWLGYAYLEKGEPARAISLLEPAVQQFAQFEFGPLQGWFTVFLAEAYCRSGDVAKARHLALRGLLLTEKSKYLYGVGWAQRALGRIALASRALSEAESHLKGALGTFDSIEARHDAARTHLDLATLAHAQADKDAVTRHLGKAHHLFMALRVPKYVERSEQLAREFGATVTGGETP